MIRTGNLMNSEIFGGPTTLPWGMWFVRSREWHAMYEGIACHPTQIYEALCYLTLFVILMRMYWKKNLESRPGLIFGVFLIGIFLPRFLIEFIKNDQVAFEADMILNMGQPPQHPLHPARSRDGGLRDDASQSRTLFPQPLCRRDRHKEVRKEIKECLYLNQIKTERIPRVEKRA